MDQFISLGGRDQGEQVAGPQHHALAQRGVRQAAIDAAEGELDPVKRAALFIRMNDLVVQRPRRHPGRCTARACAAASNKLRAGAQRLGQRHRQSVQDWYREADER